MNTTTHWHVVFTKPNCEKKTTQQLKQKGFEAYFPYHSLLQRTPVGKPLLPSYVFVYCSTSDLPLVKNLKGVVSILYWRDQPARVTREEITTLKYVLNNFETIEVHKTGIHPDRTSTATAEDKLVFPLPSLGYSLQVQAEKELTPSPEAYLVNGLMTKEQYRVKPVNRFTYLLRQLPTFFFH